MNNKIKCEKKIKCEHEFRAKRDSDDASLMLLDTVTKKLDSSSNNSNNLQQRLSDLQVHSTLTLWIKDFLMDRPQRVFLNGFKSSSSVLKTGLPQVKPPILVSAYTNITTMNGDGLAPFKYADDTNTQALTRYQQQVQTLV